MTGRDDHYIEGDVIPYIGQRVRHPFAGLGRIVGVGTGRSRHTVTIQYESGPRNPHGGSPPRGIAYVRDLEDVVVSPREDSDE